MQEKFEQKGHDVWKIKNSAVKNEKKKSKRI